MSRGIHPIFFFGAEKTKSLFLTSSFCVRLPPGEDEKLETELLNCIAT